MLFALLVLEEASSIAEKALTAAIKISFHLLSSCSESSRALAAAVCIR
jgi:hypothetical protein